MNLIKLFTLPLLVLTPALIIAQNVSQEDIVEVAKQHPVAARALELHDLFAAHNMTDLISLLKASDVAEKESGLSAEVISRKLVEKLQADMFALTAYKAELDKQTDPKLRGSFALRSSITKLIGTPKYSGILQDAAITALASPQIKEISAKNNRITVLKTLLIYKLAVLRNVSSASDLAEVMDLDLVYRAEIPLGIAEDKLETCLLSRCENSKLSLLIPNAGYVLGGDKQDQFRGVDGSSFVRYCTNCDPTLSTMLLEFAWKTLKGEDLSAIDPEGKFLEEFERDYRFQDILNHFDALTTDEVMLGDIVLWRWTPEGSKSRLGQASVFISYINDSKTEFKGIEANREDDKSLEGIFTQNHALKKPGRDTFILRSKK